MSNDVVMLLPLSGNGRIVLAARTPGRLPRRGMS